MNEKAAPRGAIEIIVTVLQAAQHGAAKTRLMQSSNLDSRRIQELLNFLFTRKFIERERNVFETTQKGLRFLEDYAALEGS